MPPQHRWDRSPRHPAAAPHGGRCAAGRGGGRPGPSHCSRPGAGRAGGVRPPPPHWRPASAGALNGALAAERFSLTKARRRRGVGAEERGRGGRGAAGAHRPWGRGGGCRRAEQRGRHCGQGALRRGAGRGAPASRSPHTQRAHTHAHTHTRAPRTATRTRGGARPSSHPRPWR